MARARDPNRNRAFEIYKEHNGNIDLVEIASQLNISPGTIRGWKSKDSWNDKLNGTFHKIRNVPKEKKGVSRVIKTQKVTVVRVHRVIRMLRSMDSFLNIYRMKQKKSLMQLRMQIRWTCCGTRYRLRMLPL